MDIFKYASPQSLAITYCHSKNLKVRISSSTNNLKSKVVDSILVMGLGQKFLTRINFYSSGRGQVEHLWFESGLGKFPLKIPNFSIFSLWLKKSPLVGSKSTWIRLLFTVGQKYARVVSGQGPSLFHTQLYKYGSRISRLSKLKGLLLVINFRLRFIFKQMI